MEADQREDEALQILDEIVEYLRKNASALSQLFQWAAAFDAELSSKNGRPESISIKDQYQIGPVDYLPPPPMPHDLQEERKTELY